MNCKHCQHTLEEGVTLCPNCGKDNAELPEEPAAQEAAAPGTQEPQSKESVKLTPGKLALTIGACVVLLAVLVALIMGGLSSSDTTGETGDTTGTTESSGQTGETVEATVPPDGNPDDVTCKGSYTAEDDAVAAAADVVVATFGDKTLTNGQLQVYYDLMVNQFLSSEDFYYMYYYGSFDYTQPLDTQLCNYDETMTWQQYFLSQALDAWHCYQALASEAESAGFELDAEYRDYLDGLAQSLEDDAIAGGFANAQEMVAYNLGSGATVENYLAFQEIYYLGYSYYQEKVAGLEPTAEEIKAYFQAHLEEYAELGLTEQTKTVDVRHILVCPEGGTTDADGNTTYSDEEWAGCLAEAQRIRDEWLNGDADEDSFAALAEEYSEDPGSNTNGGLYTDVYQGDMLETFDAWCFDSTRKVGDYGLVQTKHGYHIMYYSGETILWPEYAKSDMVTESANALIEEAMEKNPLKVDYASVVLNHLDLAS